MSHHRSRLCHFVIGCDDLDYAVEFWTAALGATEEPIAMTSRQVYRRLKPPDSDIRILLQRTDDLKVARTVCIWTWKQTTSKLRFGASKLWAPLGTTTSKNAATTSGFCGIRGITSSAFCNRNFPSC